MSTASVIKKFRARIQSGELGDLQVIYRVVGGMPAEGQINEEVELSGDKKATARSLSTPGEPRAASAQLEDERTKTLFQQIGQSLDGMVPYSKARFLPDSDVGSITIKVAGEQTTLFFQADAEERRTMALSFAPGEADAIASLDQLKQELLGKKED